MKRILSVIAGADPRAGGPIEGIRQMVPLQRAAGIQQDVVCLDPPDAPWLADFPAQVFACGVPIGAAGEQSRRLPWRHYGVCPDFIPWLRAHLRDYDVAIVHGLWNFATLGARRVLVGSGFPYVVFTHGMLDPWFKRSFPVKGAAKQMFWWFNEGPLLNNADFVLFTSEEEKEQARLSFKPYEVKERVVAYGTSDPGGPKPGQTEAFRALVPELAKPYLLYLSRIHPKKGCDLLIDAFAEVCGARDDLDLVMAGPAEGGYLAALKRQAEARGIGHRIHWPGMLRGDPKWGAFHNAEAFVLPSHQENFGIVVAEAMASGRPALISDKVNIWREVTGSGGGLADQDDAAGIARLLRRFIALSPEERMAMGQRARAAFLKHFEVTQAALEVRTACFDAVAAHRR